MTSAPRWTRREWGRPKEGSWWKAGQAWWPVTAALCKTQCVVIMTASLGSPGSEEGKETWVGLEGCTASACPRDHAQPSVT